MRTTATNRKLRFLITALREGSLISDPDFQRQLVWTNKDKLGFLDTVLKGYPFPEIYIASGSVDSETGQGTELLVDGQQRVRTLYQYFTGSKDIKLGTEIKPYAELDETTKKNFLEYEVVVRDLGLVSMDEIKEVFKRINATSYALNDMEKYNSQFNGELKKFALEISESVFFDNHRVFSINEIKRMKDLTFVLTFIITIMTGYFSLEERLEEYLYLYNDEFDQKEDIRHEINEVFTFVELCKFGTHSRVWKKSDLLTLLVEIHRLLIKDELGLEPFGVAFSLNAFYHKVDNLSSLDQMNISPEELIDVESYYKAAIQGTNSKGSRTKRGQIIRKVILEGEGKKGSITS